MLLCIKNGNIIDGYNNILLETDILIENGKIIKIDKNIDIENCIYLDADKKWVLPGLIDAHCHLRDPGYEYKEDIITGTKSAAAGGFTAVACMPNTLPSIDNAAMVQHIISRANSKGYVKVYPIGAITEARQGENLSEMGDMKEAGVIAFSDDGDPVSSPLIMRYAMEYARQFNLPIISHSEDRTLTSDGVMNEGYMSTILGLKGISRAAEEVMTSRDIILSGITGSRVHIAHVSTKGSVELIRRGKADGIKVTCETAPHYFTATDEWVESYDANTKVSPPLRTEEDLEAIIEGLKDGTIDIIATDHAPHHKDEKEIEFDLATSGISGFETAFSLSYTHLVEKNHLTLNELVEKMSTKVAEILNVQGGTLSVGGQADITIVDLNDPYKIDSSKFYSKGKNTPFDGHEVKGKIKYTLVNGKIVYQEGEIK